jgi:hypothetical protein
MNATPAYWAANVALLDDVTLLRFIDAVEARKDRYAVALTAAMNEAQRRNLIKKKAALAGGQS